MITITWQVLLLPTEQVTANTGTPSETGQVQHYTQCAGYWRLLRVSIHSKTRLSEHCVPYQYAITHSGRITTAPRTGVYYLPIHQPYKQGISTAHPPAGPNCYYERYYLLLFSLLL